MFLCAHTPAHMWLRFFSLPLPSLQKEVVKQEISDKVDITYLAIPVPLLSDI